jgi:hypothetical protein
MDMQTVLRLPKIEGDVVVGQNRKTPISRIRVREPGGIEQRPYWRRIFSGHTGCATTSSVTRDGELLECDGQVVGAGKRHLCTGCEHAGVFLPRLDRDVKLLRKRR